VAARDDGRPKEVILRRQIFTWLAGALPIATLSLIPATAGADTIRCQVPFSFTVHGKTLPPGNYTFSDDAAVLLVRGYTDGAVNLTNRLESPTEEQAKVVFEKDGDDYILTQAWMGDGTGRELMLPKTNGEHRRSARNGEVEQVAVAAR
jgi:hypothetical protein